MARPEHPTSQRTPPRGSISLFWRTFLLLALLLLGTIVAWFQTFRTLEEEPRALQSARQLASLVNLTRAALVHADAIARVSLVKTLVEEENVRIAVREPTDTHEPYNQSPLDQRVSQVVAEHLGKNTIVARQVNGFAGLWIGFEIGEDAYWLLVDPERIDMIGGVTWLVWLAIAASLSLLGALAITRLINHPLKRLSVAAARIREGAFLESRLDESVATNEIRNVNEGFNRMAEKLAQAAVDRTLMLAGISHDLRTPLARLRLETEMSVADVTTRDLMAADIEQIDAIIDKFMDYARAGRAEVTIIQLDDVIQNALQPWLVRSDMELDLSMPEKVQALGDSVELVRVISNLLENVSRYGRSADGIARASVTVQVQNDQVTLVLRDQGPGVTQEVLNHLTEPFYRADTARTSAAGAGLGLAIVQKALLRMGGQLTLSVPPEGGLQVQITLRGVA